MAKEEVSDQKSEIGGQKAEVKKMRS